ncbi:peptidoglycan-binding domain 1 protein [Salinisphaera sp. S4-8]|uniref:ExeA family protein n=1 Tax=Salinisphaera sp. S4-8 TaxID=633357 RepID=UPI00333F77EB
MYLRYYGFDDYPFSVTPDPAFLYLSASHREALGHLLYGAGEHSGFVALIGEVGTGKTTLIRALVDNDMPDLDIALCWNPHLEVREFVATICDELGASYDARRDTSLKDLVDRLNRHLLETHARNRRTVLVIDEAQNLSRGVLEQLRLLTNLETHKHKLLRIILVGQPELEQLLARHDLRQLSQRITARFKLKPLGYGETRAYVQHRLRLAGGPPHLFTGPALFAVRRVTGGIPRLINMVCERALMGGYAHSRARIGAPMVLRAAAETLPRERRARWLRVAVPSLSLAALAVVGALAWYPGIELSRAADWVKSSGASAPAVAVDTDQPSSQPDGTTGVPSEPAASARGEGGDSYRPEDGSGAAADDSPADKNDDTRVATDATSDASNPPTADKVSTPGEAEATSISSDSGGELSADNTAALEGVPAGDATITQLLRLWGVFGAQVRSGCENLRIGDLRCLADRGSFSMIERYNRPALLTIRHDGRTHKVLLSSLEDDDATLVGENGTRRISRMALLRIWNGEFEVVWRADSGVGLIQPGAVGSAVVWLRKRLDRIDGKNPETRLGPASPVYDDALERRLRDFQAANGLEADGMAGPRTQMMLNGAVPSPGSPALKPVEQE